MTNEIDRRVYVSLYTQKKTKALKLSVLLSYDLGLLISVGDKDAIETLTDAIALKVERTEAAEIGGSE